MPGADLVVAEMFGPTFQGEGPSSGQRALFLRLSRCNLSCPNCDTPYTWDWSRFDPRAEARRIDPAEIVEWVLAYDVNLVVITGGEPLLQQARLAPVVAALAADGRRIEIETNGTIVPTGAMIKAVTQFNVSPKLRSFAAAADTAGRLNDDALRILSGCGKAIFKFVLHGPSDLAEVAELEATYGLQPVWVMPEGTTAEATAAVMRTVADDVLARGWNLTARLHVLIWGDTRGR